MPETATLTPRQERFVLEYLVDLNATQAAIRAGYSAKTAAVIGCQNLGKPELAAAIAGAQQKRAGKLEITAEAVLQRWWTIANVDVRELVEYHRSACRTCWPKEPENPTINPRCGSCHGNGHGRVIVNDTRNLSPGAAMLYAGVQEGKDGIKALIEARDRALENVAKHLGMFRERVEHSGGMTLEQLILGSMRSRNSDE
jgi:phage terminase small subunit